MLKLLGFLKLNLAFIIALQLAIIGASAFGRELSPTNGESLGLMIMGSIVQKDSTNNVVLIKETKSGSVKAVRPGTTILTNFIVSEVHEKYIVLKRAEDRYTVYQNKFASEFAGSSRPSDSKPGLVQSQDYFQEEGFERRSGQIKMTGMYRDKIVNQDLAKILMQATAEPAFQNGSIVGFKLTQIDNDSIYAKSGIVDEDIITSINGVKLNNAASAISLLKSLKGENRLNIDVLRGGSTKTFTIEID